MKKLKDIISWVVLIVFVSCQKDATTIEEETPKEPDTIEVCEGCDRWWYSQNVLINIMPWGWEQCEADGNIYRYEDRDGTSATSHYPSNPGSYYVIKCTTKIIEL